MKKSFTLIEMLVSIFLFTLLFYLIMYSFKLYIKKADIELNLPKYAIVYEYLDKVISGYYPYIEKKEYFLKTNNNNEIVFVSLVPLIDNKISLIKLTCKNNSLIYYQDYVYKKYQNYQKLKFIKPYKLILLKNLNRCQIIPFIKDKWLKKIKIIINNKVYYFSTKSNWNDLNITLFIKGENF